MWNTYESVIKPSLSATFLKRCNILRIGAQLEEWMPLIMEGRDQNHKFAATRMEIGTDVNFGSLTRCMFKHLSLTNNVNLLFNYEVRGLRQDAQDNWHLKVRNIATGETRKVTAKFVFIGAGGRIATLAFKIRNTGGQRLWRFSGERAVVEVH
jgi:L-2-hydroxyglutarate oxidase LhgO